MKNFNHDYLFPAVELFAPYGRSSLSGAYNKQVSGFVSLCPNPLTRTSDTRQTLGEIFYNYSQIYY